MTRTSTLSHKARKQTYWDWFFSLTLGSFFKFLYWSVSAILLSWIIELVGMVYWWGPTHSQRVLDTELEYLGLFQRNILTGFYARDCAATLMLWVEQVTSTLQLRQLASLWNVSTESQINHWMSAGVEALINTLFIFVVRLSICISAITGFILVSLVALIDGLVERDIRRASAGVESAIVYHRTKRLIVPLVILSFGFYLTAPFSIHPTLVFLPMMAAVGFMIFTTARTFKKYL